MKKQFEKLRQQTKLNCGVKSRVAAYRWNGRIYYSAAMAVRDDPDNAGFSAIGVRFSHPTEPHESVADAIAAGWNHIAERSGGHRVSVLLGDWSAEDSDGEKPSRREWSETTLEGEASLCERKRSARSSLPRSSSQSR